MTSIEKILELLYQVVDEVNQNQPADSRLDKSRECVLFGAQGRLDSLGLVAFVIAAEQRLEDKLGRPISLSDEKAMSQKNSPFRTIGTLADYAFVLLQENGGE